jgi:hypothetical protein
MVYLTKQQRHALHKVHQRVLDAQAPSAKPLPYRQFRRTVAPGPDCVMVRFAGMWLGIERDGYTHS